MYSVDVLEQGAKSKIALSPDFWVLPVGENWHCGRVAREELLQLVKKNMLRYPKYMLTVVEVWWAPYPYCVSYTILVHVDKAGWYQTDLLLRRHSHHLIPSGECYPFDIWSQIFSGLMLANVLMGSLAVKMHMMKKGSSKPTVLI